MAWDKNRSYAPFYADGSMVNYGPHSITKDMLDIIYANGEYQPHNAHFSYRPFHNVQLKLRLASVGETVWLKDDANHEYPMFAHEFNRILNIGRFSGVVEGEWSVEKHGQIYGLILVN